jgi:LysR family transcriptional regulator, hydrogen peroxide-inducible genes activator
MARPTVRQLEYLIAVADHRNFRRAAESVGVSQPALSAQIQAVEDELGVQVFERDRRRVLITPHGAEIVTRARAALAAVDEVAGAARGLAEPLVGPLRMGVIPTVAPYVLPRLLPAVRKAFPKLELILREEQTSRLLSQLDAGVLECALLALPVPGDFTAAAIGEEPFLLAAPRGSPLVAKQRRLRQSELAGEDVLLLEDGHCLRDQALAVCQQAGSTEVAGVRATSLPTLVQMVAGGLGITLLPESAADVLVPGTKGPVQVARFAAPEPSRTLGLVWRTSSARLREYRMLADTMRAARDAGRR